MSKMAEALKKANEERTQIVSPIRESDKISNNFTMGGKMRKSWLTWSFIVVVVTVFVVFNYQEGKDAVPLSEIFPDEEVFPVDVEYEFVQEEVVASAPKEIKTVPLETQAAVPKEITVKSLVAIAPEPAEKLANYTIQIASFKDKKRAEEALVNIRSKVPSAYVASRDLGAKGVWYRIYAGRFNARNEAEISLNDIRQNYDSSFIISSKKTK
ncbi:MAG: SPOR domain-containing protein [Candidatus Omnitrophica bacterium]|nr:SPOR domain-containing protein [Candidatus Omnitrophota bacterium]